MRKILTLLLLWSASAAYGQSDRRHELGFHIGPVFFLGDVQGNKGIGTKFLKDVNLENTRTLQGLSYTYYPSLQHSRLVFRATLAYGTVKGADSLINDEGSEERGRLERNLNFKTNFFEGYLAAEYQFTRTKFRPFVSAGIGAIYFKPTGYYKGEWIPLRPLTTEAVSYSTLSAVIPVGVGLKYFIPEKNSVLALDITYRHTFTDYIDDVSTVYPDPDNLNELGRIMSFREKTARPYVGTVRGNPNNNDTYLVVSIRYGLLLGN